MKVKILVLIAALNLAFSQATASSSDPMKEHILEMFRSGNLEGGLNQLNSYEYQRMEDRRNNYHIENEPMSELDDTGEIDYYRGMCHYRGIGGPVNRENAKYEFLKSANRGFLKAIDIAIDNKYELYEFDFDDSIFAKFMCYEKSRVYILSGPNINEEVSNLLANFYLNNNCNMIDSLKAIKILESVTDKSKNTKELLLYLYYKSGNSQKSYLMTQDLLNYYLDGEFGEFRAPNDLSIFKDISIDSLFAQCVNDDFQQFVLPFVYKQFFSNRNQYERLFLDGLIKSRCYKGFFDFFIQNCDQSDSYNLGVLKGIYEYSLMASLSRSNYDIEHCINTPEEVYEGDNVIYRNDFRDKLFIYLKTNKSEIFTDEEYLLWLSSYGFVEELNNTNTGQVGLKEYLLGRWHYGKSVYDLLLTDDPGCEECSDAYKDLDFAYKSGICNAGLYLWQMYKNGYFVEKNDSLANEIFLDAQRRGCVWSNIISGDKNSVKGKATSAFNNYLYVISNTRPIDIKYNTDVRILADCAFDKLKRMRLSEEQAHKVKMTQYYKSTSK